MHVPLSQDDGHAALSRRLHAAFPCQEDMNVLFEAGRAATFMQCICTPYGDLFLRGCAQTAEALARQPPATAHPILLARKLLYLSLSIQQLDPEFELGLLQSNIDLGQTMRGTYDLVSSTVTCHDELLDSREGLECLVCESVYLTNLGNLRLALVCLRRAASLCQLMGMNQKGPNKRPICQLDPDTRVADYFTFGHIAYLERYISLLLGIPSAISCARFAPATKPDTSTNAEYFERFQTDICERIITQQQSGEYNISVTHAIDTTMTMTASTFSDTWWRPMTDIPADITPHEGMARAIDAQTQMIHFNMLNVLHLPYLLRQSSSEAKYSKITCLLASREVLNRWCEFRAIMRVVYCCRPVDFCAFTAVLTLLLAHLRSDGERDRDMQGQREGDRALVERVVGMLDELNRLNGDELSLETAQLARKLLDLEQWAARSGKGVDVTFPLNDGQHERGDDFLLTVPYVGTLNLAPKSSRLEGLADPDLWAQFEGLMDGPMKTLLAATEDWAFQGVDTMFWTSAMDV